MHFLDVVVYVTIRSVPSSSPGSLVCLPLFFPVWLLERGCIVAQAILKLSYVAQVG